MSKLKIYESPIDFTAIPHFMQGIDFDGDVIDGRMFPIFDILKKCGIDPRKNMRYGKKQAQKYFNDQMNIVRSTITEMAIRKTVCIKTFMLSNGTQRISFALPNKQTASAIVSTGSVMNYLWKLSPHGVQILSQRDTQPKIGEKRKRAIPLQQ